MPPGTRQSAATPSKPGLDLPPPFRLVTLREAGDAFAHAQAIAPEQGAGTLVVVGRSDVAEFALVLEPDEPLRTARGALYAGMNALADALAVHAPPEKSVAFGWPDAVYVDGAVAGGMQLAWPSGAEENAPPPWLVLGATIRMVSALAEPGLQPQMTALVEEGFTDLAPEQLVESFARHFMVAIDAWQEHGFAALARDYLARLSPEKNVRRDLAENGDLLVRRPGIDAAERRPLVTALASPSWLAATAGVGR
jgi:biotin-(acetyl-CoA carboxylase) ligase